MHFDRLRSAVALSLLTIAACQKTSQVPPPATRAVGAKDAAGAVAVVDGAPIGREIYDFYTRSIADRKAAELTSEQKSQILDELINTQLVANQAVKDGVDKLPETVAQLEVARLRLLADDEARKYLKGKEPTDAELHAEYDQAVASLDKTEYHARHILVADKALADRLTAQLNHGAKFEALAKANSMDPSKEQGGELPWFTANKMVKPFSDAVKTLKKGQVTAAPVQTQYGWHIIKLEDIREAAPPGFDRVKDQLSNRIMQKKLQAYVESLRKTAKIEKKI